MRLLFHRTIVFKTNSIQSSFTCCRFDPTGRYVFAGTSQSTILVFNTRTKQVLILYIPHPSKPTTHNPRSSSITTKYLAQALSKASASRRAVDASSRTPPTASSASSTSLRPTRSNWSRRSQSRSSRCTGLVTLSRGLRGIIWRIVLMGSGLLEVCLGLDYTFLSRTFAAGLRTDCMSVFDLLRIGSADPATHKIYMWDISNDGIFATALDGGREPLLDVTVCPDISNTP